MKQIQNISLNPCAALRVAAALFLALGMITTQAETPKEMFERILKEGVIGPQTGKTTEDGNFIMAVDSVKMDENIQPNQLLRAAARIAQRNVAGFLGEHITVDEELKKVSITNKTIDEMGIVKVDVKRTRESRSVIRTQIDQAMAAAGIFDSKVEEGRLYVGYILSEKQLLSVGLLKKTPNGGFAPVEPGENPPDDVSGVVATGLAMISKNDVADARDRAMKSAQRSAVEQAFGVCVKATSQLRDLDPATLKDKQFTASFGALKGHEVLSEGQEGTIYKIKIRAVVTRKIKPDVIVKAWQSNGASFFLNPGPDEDNPGADLLDVFGDFFKGLGFNITNKREAADYEIFLKSKHLNKIHPTSGRELTQLQLTVQIKDPRTGTLVLTQMNDARRAVNDLADKARRLQICAQKACRQLDKPLKAKVGKLVMDMLQNGRDIQVVFRGVDNANGAGYKFIEHQIEWMPGIRGGFNKAMYPKKREMVYKAKFSGPMDAIQTALTEALVARYDDDRPMMAQMGANHLVYQVAGGGGAAVVPTPGKPNPPHNTNTQSSGGGLSAQSLAKQSRACVVRLDMYKGGKISHRGSGFFVGPNLVVSNHHVVQPGFTGTVQLAGKKETYRITRFLALDARNDLALVQVEGPENSFLQLGNADKITVGDKIYSVGSPLGLDGTFAPGSVSAVDRQAPWTRESCKVIQITAPISPGSSGGPIINSKCEVVGVAVRAPKGGSPAQLLNFAVPVNYLKMLLKEANIK
jgi:S1-C subfamily serine protease